MSFSTANRMYFLTLAQYGEDAVLIEELEGTESLSDMFHFRLRALSSSDAIDAKKIIGDWAIVRMETWDTHTMGGERHWYGYVASFRRTGRVPSAEDHDLYSYELTVVPWLWFMTRHQDIRIFQDLSIPDIIEKIFDEHGFKDYQLMLSEEHPKLIYCTQYQETNQAFIARLMERAGIYTYYKHNEGRDARHTLVLSDHVNGNPKMEPATVPFHHAGTAEGADAITSLLSHQSMRTGKTSLRDWDFEKKRVVPAETPTTIHIGGNDKYEHYHYPAGYVEAQLGSHFTKVMMEAEEAAYLTLSGASQVRQMEPGYTFTLEDHLFDDFNREYLVVSVQHYGRNNLTAGGGESTYGNAFTVQPHDVPYRSLPRTPRPRVYGPQTAIVTGPAGDEIHTDKYGRIKVQFHWDREGKYNASSSCWMRVAQMWAGNGYGTMFIPRVGMEVVVSFLEGDPDQPLVTGCVYNGINEVPYKLPDNATRSTIKTLSSKGGGGTNELRFEDKKGSEEIFIHAQRDQQQRIKRNLSISVGASSSETVGGDKSTSVTGNRSHTCKEYKSTAEKIEHLSGNHAVTTGAMSFKSEVKPLKSGTPGEFKVEAATAASIKSPLQVMLEAGATLSMKCGASSITMSPMSIMIQAPLVTVNSGGSGLLGKLADLADQALDAAEALLGKAGDKIQGMAQKALARMLLKARRVAGTILRTSEGLRQGMGAATRAAAGAARAGADAAGGAIGSLLGQTAGRAIERAGETTGRVIESAGKTADRAAYGVSKAAYDVTQATGNAARALWGR